MKRLLKAVLCIMLVLLPSTALATTNNEFAEKDYRYKSDTKPYSIIYRDNQVADRIYNLDKPESKGYLEPYVGVYYVRDREKISQRTQEMINGFETVAETKDGQIEEVLKYILEQNICYAQRNMLVEEQINYVGRQQSQCLGITYFAKQLLDKTEVAYRIIYVSNVDEETLKTRIGSVSHIYLEVQDDSGRWNTFDLIEIAMRPCKDEHSKAEDRTAEEVKTELEQLIKDIKAGKYEVEDYKRNNLGNFDSFIRHIISPTFRKGRVLGGNSAIFKEEYTYQVKVELE